MFLTMTKLNKDTRRNSGKPFKAFRRKIEVSEKESGAISTLPVLVPADGSRPSNIHKCLEKWKQHVLMNFGSIGSIFSDFEYPKLDRPKKPSPDELEGGNLRASMMRKLLWERLKNNDKKGRN